MNYLYEATDANGQTVMGRMDGLNEADVQRKLLLQGYQAQAIAPVGPNTPAVAPQDRTLMNPTPQGHMTAYQNAAVLSQAVPQTQTAATSTARRTGGITLAGNAAKVATLAQQTRQAQGFAPPGQSAVDNASRLGGVSTRDLMFFFQQLASLVKSGMSIYSALDNLAPRTPNRNLAQAAKEMADQARNGGRISDVMEQYPRIYPAHIVGMVRAGELGGFLEIALAEIALNYEQNIALYRHAWIPKMMATQSLFILALVIPLVPSLYAADFSVQAFVTNYLKQVCFLYLPLAFVLFYGSKWGAARLQLPQFRYVRDSLSLKLPPFGDLQRQAAIAAFVRMLRKLYHAGVAPIAAWEGAMHTASNVVIRDRLAQSYALMQQGASLPDAFTATGLFTNSIENLVITGHHSGEVVESLDKVADYYQDQIDQAAARSKFMMLRFGILAMLVLGGAAMLWLAHTYYGGMFTWVDRNFGTE